LHPLAKATNFYGTDYSGYRCMVGVHLNNKSDSLADSSFKTLLANIALSLSRNSKRISRTDSKYTSLKESINEYINNNPIK
jgi:hypothetical protein